ncbi:hypothetical protein Tco_1215584 [Tanacetum coccineum]
MYLTKRTLRRIQLNDLKLKDLDYIQEMFDRAFKRKLDDFEEEYQVLGRIVGIKSLLKAASITAALIDVNVAQLKIDQGVGSTSGIRACALRNFDLEVMELENTQNNALAKLPMLKLGEYEMWEIRIKQYFQIQDYALWEVIENGNSWVPIPVTAPETGPSTATKMTVPSTAEEKTLRERVFFTCSFLPWIC